MKTKQQLGVRVSPQLNELLAERAKELGTPKGNLVEDMLWLALSLENPDEPKVPPAFRNLVDRIGASLAAHIEKKG